MSEKKSKIKIGSNKSFGIVFFIFFLIVSLYPIINNNELRLWALLLAFAFLILGIKNSDILTPLNRIWFRLGIVLGKFVSPLVMGLIFFLVVTPTGLLLKVFNKDILNLKKKKNKSYWIYRGNEKNSMKNQF